MNHAIHHSVHLLLSIPADILPDSALCSMLRLAGVGALEYVAVIAATMIDLWSGVRRARREKRRRTSRGLRRTVGKLTSYLMLLCMLTAVDMAIAAGCAFLRGCGVAAPPPFLWLTSLGALAHILIEAKSVTENLEHGPKLRQTVLNIFNGYRRLRRM